MRWNDKRHVWMSWNGRMWTKAVYAPRPARLTEPAPFGPTDEVDEAKRRRMLDAAVEAEVLRGGTVQDRRELSCVLGYPRPVNHLGHFLATVITGGLWAVVWIVMAVSRREDRVLLAVDAYGNVWGRES